jgi:ACS family tartrate transporter-like MFS transporter
VKCPLDMRSFVFWILYTYNSLIYENGRPMSMIVSVETIEQRVIRKIGWRILPYLFVLYVVAYLDRVNVAFAKNDMMKALVFSEADFGFGAGLFFLGYFLLEIPGALIVERWSARKWIARILLSWGVCTVLIGLVQSASQFYTMRFLLGAAEAGFFPGVIVYLTHWFPAKYRARAMGAFILFGCSYSRAFRRFCLASSPSST